LLLVVALGRHVRHLQASPAGVELPAVIDAAQPALLVASEEERRPAVRAVRGQQPHAALGVANGQQVFAQQANAHGWPVRLRQLRAEQGRLPVMAHEMAHRSAGAHACQELVFFFAQHRATSSVPEGAFRPDIIVSPGGMEGRPAPGLPPVAIHGHNVGDTGTRMRYRCSTYRYTMVMHYGPGWPFGDIWPTDRLRLLTHGRWRPDADIYETATTIEIVIALAGVEEAALDLQLFEAALVVAGHRHLPAGPAGAVYHGAAIRQGPFQVALALPAPVDPDRIEARYDRGLLQITLAKRAGAT